MPAATTITVQTIGTGDDAINGGNLQEVLGQVVGKLTYAVQASGQAKGTADWSAQKLGAIHYHLKEIGASIGYDVPALDVL